jgi:hypothetical protein
MNGAWSDIILGAVMGAARRVEMRQRYEAPEPRPELPAPVLDVLRQAPDPSAASNDDLRFDATGVWRDPPQTAKSSTFDWSPASMRSAGRTSAPPANAKEEETEVAADPVHSARFGPYAQTYRPRHADRTAKPHRAPKYAWPPPLPEDIAPMPANSNSVQSVQDESRNTGSSVVAMANLDEAAEHEKENTETAVTTAASEAMASVTLKRETATFTLPVDTPAMPPSLKAALAAVAGRGRGEEAPKAEVIEVEEAELEDDFAARPLEPFSAAERALIRRMAPPEAERKNLGQK